jgi:hypothetical protein
MTIATSGAGAGLPLAPGESARVVAARLSARRGASADEMCAAMRADICAITGCSPFRSRGNWWWCRRLEGGRGRRDEARRSRRHVLCDQQRDWRPAARPAIPWFSFLLSLPVDPGAPGPRPALRSLSNVPERPKARSSGSRGRIDTYRRSCQATAIRRHLSFHFQPTRGCPAAPRSKTRASRRGGSQRRAEPRRGATASAPPPERNEAGRWQDAGSHRSPGSGRRPPKRSSAW